MSKRTGPGISTAILLTIAVPAARGQVQDTIAGRVVATSNSPIPGALVVLTVRGDSVSRATTRADSAGAYRIVLRAEPRGYRIAVSFIGYAPQSRILERENPDQHSFVADFRLVPNVQALGPIKVAAPRRRPVRSDGRQTTPGAAATTLDLGNSVGGDPAGGLAAAMTALPGLTVIPDPTGGIPSVSAFGLSADQNAVTLNGMNFFGEALPRDGLRAQVVASTYDPGKGGFGGAQVSLQLPMGGNAGARALRSTLESRWMQTAPSRSANIDSRYERFIMSGTASGPVRENRMFYSTAAQVTRRQSDVVPLEGVGPGLLNVVNLDPDSVSRLLGIAQNHGFPSRGLNAVANSENISGSGLIRFDYLPPVAVGNSAFMSDDYSLLIGATGQRQTGLGISPFALASSSARRENGNMFVQVGASRYPKGAYLNDSYLILSASRATDSPELSVPTATVNVNSDNSAPRLRLGGGVNPITARNRHSLQLRNETSWYAMDSRHFFQITLDVTADRASASERAPGGIFAFESLDDFANNSPSSFQRTLMDGTRRASSLTGALGIGSVFTAGPAFQLQYGVRGEYNRISGPLERNTIAASALGVRTDVRPSAFTLAPMAGFMATAGKFVANGASRPRFDIAGGIRLYTSPLSSSTFAQVVGGGDPLQLSCVGSAAPIPNWSAYFASTGQVPSQCASGAPSELALRAERLIAYSPTYRPAKSWRAQLQTGVRVTETVMGQVGVTAIFNRGQPQPVERNFSGIQRFSLAGEGGRPVFVAPNGIDAGSGLVSGTTSRLTDQLGRVTQVESNGMLNGTQLEGSLGYRPSTGGIYGGGASYQLSYAYNRYRARSVGFASTTAGDPRDSQWSDAPSPSHTVTAAVTLPVGDLMTVQTLARMTSGTRYTPLVARDINGDGYANDRAFVFDRSGSDPATADAISTLMNRAPARAAACLRSQQRHTAGQNSCLGPWAASLNAVVTFNRYRLGLGHRGNIQLILTNLLAGADALLHGTSGLKGWGQPTFPDATLLTPTGFDATTRAFRYDVNPYFGSSTTARGGFRAPFSMSIDFRLDVGPDRETAWLKQMLRPLPGDSLLTPQEMRRRIAPSSVSAYDIILRFRDSLSIDSTQTIALMGVAERYRLFRDSVYNDLTGYLASLDGNFDDAGARDRWHAAIDVVTRASVAATPTIREILTTEQYQRLPITVRQYLERTEHQLDRLLRTPQVGNAPP